MLKLFPLLRGFVVLAMDHVRVDFLGGPDRAVAQARAYHGQWHAVGQQVRRVCMAQNM